ncbi:hypothetical protein PR048_017193 [Dryococelus australis]|uniref:Zinc finger PHD-type domain-containing protein n=1 Tax=Dryococelus australis TaxID=614101 RepID=A0ABQ9H8V0_9NEOP|nr:hypothetical protein PR048_017193 [Dryococelus australis]
MITVPLKKFLKQRGNAFQRIWSDDALLLNKAFMMVATFEKAVSEFSAVGIYPMNLDKFTNDNFAFSASGRSASIVTVSDDVTESENGWETNNKTFNKKTFRMNLMKKQKVASKLALLNVKGPLSRTISIRYSDINHIPSPIAGPSKQTSRPKWQHSGGGGCNKKNQFVAKKKFFDSGSSDEASDIISLSHLCDDNEIDDLESLSCVIAPTAEDSCETCMFCGEFGRNKELWFWCGLCSGWVHADCNAAVTAEHFVFDFCQN